GPEWPPALISREYRIVLRQWMKNPMGIGAVAPSSRRLADAMARQVPAHGNGPVVELGGGTGNITAGLLRAGIAPSRLVVVERDPTLHRLLQHRYPRLRVVEGDAAALGHACSPWESIAPMRSYRGCRCSRSPAISRM